MLERMATTSSATTSIPNEGRLASFSLENLLGRIGIEKASGVLCILRKKLERKVVVLGGRVEVLISNARDDRLFEWAMEQGRFRDRPASDQQDLMQEIGNLPLVASRLCARGWLEEEGAVALLREHLGALLDESARWSDARFTFTPGRPGLGGEITAGWPAIEAALHLLAAGVDRSPPKPKIPDALISQLPPSLRRGLSLQAIDHALLDAAQAAIAYDDLLEKINSFPREAIHDATLRWLRIGVLSRAAIAPRNNEKEDQERAITRAEIERWLSAAEREDLAAVLGVEAGCSASDAKAAYYRAVRRYHPDRYREGSLADLHDRIESAFRLVREALLVLTDPAAKERWDKRRHLGAKKAEPSHRAKELMLMAKKAALEGRRTQAVKFLQQAGEMHPEEPLYATYHALLLLGNPRERARAAQALAELAKRHPGSAEVLEAYGLALQKTGEAAKARQTMERVLSLDAKRPAARAVLGDSTAAAKARENPFLGPLIAE